MENETAIITLAKAGDRAAAGQLYSFYFDQIYRYLLMKLGNVEEAEDVAQSVFISALKNITSYREQEGAVFSSWLYRIAHNKYVDMLRKRNKVIVSPIDEALGLASSDITSQEKLERKEQSLQMLKALQRLTEDQKEVVTLRFGRALSILETARIMGKSEGAVKALQHAAIKSLQKKLHEEY